MKKPILEKSTIKWMVVWFLACFISWIVVFAAGSTWQPFTRFQENGQNPQLTQVAWNQVMAQLDELKTQVESEINNGKIPVGAVMIFDWPCPAKWTAWGTDANANKFILPKTPSHGQATWGSGEIVISLDNLPEHTHTIIWNSQGAANLDANTALAVYKTNSEWWYQDYSLMWTSAAATLWKTSVAWKGKPIKWYMPEYIRVQFCKKTQE